MPRINNAPTLSQFVTIADKAGDNRSIKVTGNRVTSSFFTPKAEENAKSMRLFINALTKDFGSAIAALAADRLQPALAQGGQLTARMVRDVVSDAKLLFQQNSQARNLFLSGMDPDNSFAAELDKRLQDKADGLDQEALRGLRGEVMREFSETFASRHQGKLTMEAMKDFMAGQSAVLAGFEKLAATARFQNASPQDRKAQMDILFLLGGQSKALGFALEMHEAVRVDAGGKDVDPHNLWSAAFPEDAPIPHTLTGKDFAEAFAMRLTARFNEETPDKGARMLEACNAMDSEAALRLIKGETLSLKDFHPDAIRLDSDAQEPAGQALARGLGPRLSYSFTGPHEAVSTPATLTIAGSVITLGDAPAINGEALPFASPEDRQAYLDGKPSTVSARVEEAVSRACGGPGSAMAESVMRLCAAFPTDIINQTGAAGLAALGLNAFSACAVTVTPNADGSTRVFLASSDDPAVTAYSGRLAVDVAVGTDGKRTVSDLSLTGGKVAPPTQENRTALRAEGTLKQCVERDILPKFSQVDAAHLHKLMAAISRERQAYMARHHKRSIDASDTPHILDNCNLLSAYREAAHGVGRHVSGALPDKLDIAGMLSDGDPLVLSFALQRARAAREYTPKGAITPAALWRACFGEAIPNDAKKLSGKDLSQKLKDRFTSLLAEKAPGASPAAALFACQKLSFASVLAIANDPARMITEKDLLGPGVMVKPNSGVDGKHSLEQDLGRLDESIVGPGGEKIPLSPRIAIGDMTLDLGENTRLDGKPFPFTSPQDKARFKDGGPSSVVDMLMEKISGVCGNNKEQANSLAKLLSQAGVGFIINMLRGLARTPMSEHMPFSASVTAEANGDIRLHVATSRDPVVETQRGSVSAEYVIRPDGDYDLTRMNFVRTGETAAMPMPAPPTLQGAIEAATATMGKGLSEENRAVIREQITTATQYMRGADDPRLGVFNAIAAHPRLLATHSSSRAGWFDGAAANARFALVQRFAPASQNLGFMLSTVEEALKIQPEGEPRHETLWRAAFGRDLPGALQGLSDIAFFDAYQERMCLVWNYDPDQMGVAGIANVVRPHVAATLAEAPRVLTEADVYPGALTFARSPRTSGEEALRRDIQRMMDAENGTPPRMTFGETVITLGANPSVNGRALLRTEEQARDYRSGWNSPVSMRLMQEIRRSCGGKRAPAEQTDAVAYLLSQGGSSMGRILGSFFPINRNEHACRAATINSEANGMMRVTIAMPGNPEDANYVSISYLVDGRGEVTVDRLRAAPRQEA